MRSETEIYLRRKLSHKFVDQILGEIPPLGVDRTVDWFALPFGRVEELLREAQLSHTARGLKVNTRFKELLDDECRNAKFPVRQEQAAPLNDSGEIDMDALIRSAPLHGTARRNR
ncbi:hypothetical protein DEMA109039_22715 [Deinococcus marmoris]